MSLEEENAKLKKELEKHQPRKTVIHQLEEALQTIAAQDAELKKLKAERGAGARSQPAAGTLVPATARPETRDNLQQEYNQIKGAAARQAFRKANWKALGIAKE